MKLNADILMTLGFSKMGKVWAKNETLIGEKSPNNFTINVGSYSIDVIDVKQLNNLWLGINPNEKPLPIDNIFINALKDKVEYYIHDSKNLINIIGVGVLPDSVKPHYNSLIDIRTSLKRLKYELLSSK